MTKNELEARFGQLLRRGWILDGPGPARFGWARLAPCKEVWLGRTLAEVAGGREMTIQQEIAEFRAAHPRPRTEAQSAALFALIARRAALESVALSQPEMGLGFRG